MPAPRPVAVLFDLDGTLIDSIPLLLACVRHAFEGFDGRAPTDDEWIAGIGTPLASQLRAFAPDDDAVANLTARYRGYQREHDHALTTVFPGALDVLQTLYDAGHPMALVTSKSNEMMDRAIAYTGIDRYMATAIGCDSSPLHKPDPYPVRLALAELGYDAHEALFVGDSPHDMNAGNAAGVVTIAALWGPFTREQLTPTNPAHYIDDVTALPSLVDRIQNRLLV